MALEMKLFICLLTWAAFADAFPKQKVTDFEMANYEDSPPEQNPPPEQIDVIKDGLLMTPARNQFSVDPPTNQIHDVDPPTNRQFDVDPPTNRQFSVDPLAEKKINVDPGFVVTHPEIHRRLSIDQIIANAARPSKLAGTDPMPDDMILVELDMLYKKEDWAAIQERRAAKEGDRHGRKAINEEHYRWTDKTIPYDIEPNTFSDAEKAEITKSLDVWNKFTCLNFRQSDNQNENHVYFQNGQGCSSNVGMVGGKQGLNLGSNCRVVSVILHEVGHAIGLQHEQSRSDRDDWVTIDLSNVEPGMEFNFEKEDTNNFDITYDYRSIMHYGETFFAVDESKPTVITKDPFFQKLIGTYSNLSFRDIRIVNEMYSCNADCPQKTCPGEGFVGKDCQCWCPGNPVQVCGETNPIVPIDYKCEDEKEECAEYAGKGWCDTGLNVEYMRFYCKASCKVCDPNCVDKDGNCDYYSHIGACEWEKDYMTSTCPMSCHFCDPINP